MIDLRVDDPDVDLALDGLGRGVRRLHGGRQVAREVDADDRVGAGRRGGAERLLERARRRRRGLGQHVGGGHLLVEVLDAELDAVGVLVVAEADGERHDLDAERVGLLLRQIARAVGDDADSCMVPLDPWSAGA